MTALAHQHHPSSLPIVLGWREWVELPALNLPPIKAKIDTGARTSSLHAFSVEVFEVNNVSHVKFGVHPRRRATSPEVWCSIPLHDERVISDSGGHRELRYVVCLPVKIGNTCFDAEFSLTNRDNMMFRMLLGRTAMFGRFIVDPSRSYVLGRKPPNQVTTSKGKP